MRPEGSIIGKYVKGVMGGWSEILAGGTAYAKAFLDERVSVIEGQE